MGDKRFAGSKFWLMGAAYWIAIAALIGAVHRFWPAFPDSSPFFFATVAGVVIGGFAIVYLFRPK